MPFFPEDTPFYSSKQNQFIENFITKNFPLDNIGSISSSIDAISKTNIPFFKKSGPVYSMHRYWTKQPIEIIEKYITQFCPPGGLVLDPFCGSGTTGTAALYSERRIILSDLSPIATFITKNYTEKSDLIRIESFFSDLKVKIKPFIEKFYSTECPNCHSDAKIKDWIYSENYLCPKCNDIIHFINSNDISNFDNITSKKHSKTVSCHTCNNSFSRNILKSTTSSILGLRYSCIVCKTRKSFKILDEHDSTILKDKSLIINSSSYLKIPLPLGVSTKQAINKGILFVNQFFTPLTFYILTNLWLIINSYPIDIRSKFQFIFSSILYRVTKMYRLRVKGQGGILSGTLYIPPLFQDINVWDVFLERYRKISRGWRELNKKLPENYNQMRIISTHSATNLPIPSNSIDYIYTDPPYGGNINYSELNFLWEVWFDLATDKTNEVIINEIGQKKNLMEYERLFSMSLNEIYRVLKPNSWCSLVFNSSSSRIWSSIQKIINESSFQLAQDITSVRSKMTTAKQTQSLKTARNYMILNLFKEDSYSINSNLKFSTIKLIASSELEKLLVSEIKLLISSSSEHILGYNTIYDYIISKIVPNYAFNEIDLEFILKKHFIEIKKDHWSI